LSTSRSAKPRSIRLETSVAASVLLRWLYFLYLDHRLLPPFRRQYFHNLKRNGFAERLPVPFGALNTGRMQSHEDVHLSFPEIHVGIGQTKSSMSIE
jgi:hypothetical protein